MVVPLAAVGAAVGVCVAVSAIGAAEGCRAVEPGSAFADAGAEAAGPGDCEAELDAARATPMAADVPASVDEAAVGWTEAGAEPAAPPNDGTPTVCAAEADGRAIVSAAVRATPIGDDPALDADALACANEPDAAVAVPRGEAVAAIDAADAGTGAAEPIEDVAASSDVAVMDMVFAAGAGTAEPGADTVEPPDEGAAALGALFAAGVSAAEAEVDAVESPDDSIAAMGAVLAVDAGVAEPEADPVVATGALFAAEARGVEPDAPSAGDGVAAIVAAENG